MPVSIAPVAHDRMKPDMVSWAARHAGVLRASTIYATGATGNLVKERCPGLDITLLKSGPLGGDQQVGALIAEGHIFALLFFTDPLSALH
jgi:methylglyoxal synthase